MILKKKNKGFILATTVAFIAVFSVLLSLVITGASLPVSVCSSHSRYTERMRALDRIGNDFADDLIIDGEYEEYEIVTDNSSYVEIFDRETGRKLLTVVVRDGKTVLWKYGEFDR